MGCDEEEVDKGGGGGGGTRQRRAGRREEEEMQEGGSEKAECRRKERVGTMTEQVQMKRKCLWHSLEKQDLDKDPSSASYSVAYPVGSKEFTVATPTVSLLTSTPFSSTGIGPRTCPVPV